MVPKLSFTSMNSPERLPVGSSSVPARSDRTALASAAAAERITVSTATTADGSAAAPAQPYQALPKLIDDFLTVPCPAATVNPLAGRITRRPAATVFFLPPNPPSLPSIAPPVDPAIAALNAALVVPDMVIVADLAARPGVAVRSVERLSRRTFGFAPKLLLRRQRFLRSLERFLLDPDLTWLGALDCHYHDQSHFVRDFRRFMGMYPSDYARKSEPLLAAAAQARMAVAGHAMQRLHDPAGRVNTPAVAKEAA